MRLDLTPPRASRAVKKSFLIMCQNGDQSAYLEWLKSEFDHPLLTIRMHPEGLSAQAAIAATDKIRRSEKRMGTHFDQAWCLLALPSEAELKAAILAARTKRVDLAAIVGDFRDWLEMHWDSNEPLPRILVHETSSEGFAAALHERIEIALNRADKSRARTTIDLLIHALSQ